FTVLTATEEDEVTVSRRKTVADAHRLHRELDAAPGAAPAKRNDVAAVAIDVHQVRIEVHQRQPQRRVGGVGAGCRGYLRGCHRSVLPESADVPILPQHVAQFKHGGIRWQDVDGLTGLRRGHDAPERQPRVRLHHNPLFGYERVFETYRHVLGA